MGQQYLYLRKNESKQLEALALKRGVSEGICVQQIVRAFLKSEEEKNICAD